MRRFTSRRDLLGIFWSKQRFAVNMEFFGEPTLRDDTNQYLILRDAATSNVLIGIILLDAYDVFSVTSRIQTKRMKSILFRAMIIYFRLGWNFDEFESFQVLFVFVCNKKIKSSNFENNNVTYRWSKRNVRILMVNYWSPCGRRFFLFFLTHLLRFRRNDCDKNTLFQDSLSIVFHYLFLSVTTLLWSCYI